MGMINEESEAIPQSPRPKDKSGTTTTTTRQHWARTITTNEESEAVPQANRIKDKVEAPTIAADDWTVLDGETNGVRKFDPKKFALKTDIGAPSEVTQAELDAEAAARIAGDAALSTRIDALPSVPGGAVGYTVVTTPAEVLAAVAVPNRLILWVGTITMTQEIVFNVPGVRIFGGEGAKCIRDTPTGQSNIFLVFAPRCEIHNLEITGNNPLAPLTFGVGSSPDDPPIEPYTQRQDCAIRINPTYQASPLYYYDTSDFVLNHCHIHHVSRFVWLTGAPVAPWADRIRITNNRMESSNYKGIDVNWNMRDLLIENNWIWGRKIAEPTGRGQRAETTETHRTPGNAIWVGNFNQKCTIRGNDIAQFERHGIESWHDHSGNNSTSMDGLIIVDNNIHDMVPPTGVAPTTWRSMGISIVSGGHGCVVEGNNITNCTWYGIELMNADNSKGRCLVVGNFIKDLMGYNGYGIWGISVNSTYGVLVSNNYLENFRTMDNAATVGIMVAGGAMVGHGGWISFEGPVIADNVLVDAGNQGIIMAGEYIGSGPEQGLRRCGTIKGNVIRLTDGRQYRPGVNGLIEDAIEIAYCGDSCVVKDNIYYYPAAKPPVGRYDSFAWAHQTGFDLLGYGTVRTGHAADAPVAGTNPLEQKPLAQSNLTIAYNASGLSSP